MTNNNQPLTGEELLRKVEENKDFLSELELMRTCGYVSKDKDGNDYQDFAAWWEAFLVAKGRGAFPPNPDFRAYWEADVQKKLNSIKQESSSSSLNSPKQKPRNSPPKENQSPLGVFPSSPLVGQELLDKIEELGDLDTLRRMDIVMRCGYISKREDGSDRVNYFAFYEAHARAQGLITQEESFIPADILKISEGEWNDYTEVIEDLRRRSKPKTAAEYLDRGCDKDDQKDSKGAIEDYSKAIELNPNYVEAYANRGCAKEELGDKEGAISDWQKAADLGDEEAAKWIQELNANNKIVTPKRDAIIRRVDANDEIEWIYTSLINDKENQNYSSISKPYLIKDLKTTEGATKFFDQFDDEIVEYLVICSGGDIHTSENFIEISIKCGSDLEDPEEIKRHYLRSFQEVSDDEDVDFPEAIEVVWVMEKTLKPIQLANFKKELVEHFTNNLETEVVNQSFEYRCGGKEKLESGDKEGAIYYWKKAAELGDEDAAKLLEEHCE